MSYRIPFVLAFMLAHFCTLSAQRTIITGTVRDAKTKEGLPMASVYFDKTNVWAVADAEGNFSIDTETPSDTLTFSFLGYIEKRVPIKKQSTQTLEIYLPSQDNTLQTATVEVKRGRKIPKDTFALEVWHKIVANKAQNQRGNAAYISYQDYTKTQFDLYRAKFIRKIPMFRRKNLGFVPNYLQNDGLTEYLPSFFKETVSQVYLQTNPKKRREIVQADRFSGVENQSISQGLEVHLYEMNLYNNVIELMGKSFISPFATGGNLTYRFFITDSLKKDGDTYYKMDFWAKSAQDLAFAGTAWIHEPTYAIEKASFEIPQNSNINYVQRYKVDQVYTRLPDGTWLRTHEDVESVMAGWKRKDRDPLSVILRKSSRLYNIQTSATLPDSLIKGDNQYLKGAFTANDSIWDAVRPTKLSREERGIYKMIDSIKQTKTFKRIYGVGYTLTSAYIRTGKIEWGRVFEMVSWNAVEGTRLKLAARTANTFSKQLSLNGFVAYGTKDEQWKAGGGFSWNIPNKANRWQNLRGAYRYDYTMPGNINQMLTYDNILTSLTRRVPLTKLLKMQTAELAFSRGWGRGLDNTFAVRHLTFYAGPNSGFDFSNGQQQIDKFSVSEFQIGTHWGPGEMFFSNGANARVTLGSKLPVFYLDYTFRYMDNFLNQNLTNHKLDLRIRHRWNWQLGYTRYTLKASKIWGLTPYPLMTVHLGNGSWLYNRFAFNMMNESEFITDASVSLNFNHHFDGYFLNKIPLIRKLKFREIFIFNALSGTLDPKNLAIMQLPNQATAPKFYAEIGFGIENILQLFRVDFMWRLTQLDLPTSRPFGIKFTFAPKF